MVAVAADQAFNDGTVTSFVVDEAVEPAAGFFLEVLNPLIAEIFNAIGQVVYDALALDVIDKVAIAIITGGTANIIDVIDRMLRSTFEAVKDAIDEVKGYIDTIKNGLDAIGALDFVKKFIGQGSEVHEELIEITDGNGNYGYMSSSDEELIKGSGGLQALADVLGSLNLKSLAGNLQNSIVSLRDSLDSNTERDAMDTIMTFIQNLLEGAQSAFKTFLDKVDSLGSLQFLVTAEIAGIAGVVLECGVSIDVKQLLYYLTQGNWDPSFSSLAAFHVAYAVDVGVQGGGDVGLSIAYHTSRVTGVSHINSFAH